MTTRTIQEEKNNRAKHTMSTTTRIRPKELALPVSTEEGLWLKQPAPPQTSQHQQDQQRSSSDLAQREQLDFEDHPDQHCQQRPQQPQLLTKNNNADLFVLVNPNFNSSASDLATPVTPTFSSHGGSHLRYASSTSSLDLQQSFSACSDSPVSPTHPPQTQNPVTTASPIASASTKRVLPDVQEDPYEREDDQDEHTMTSLTDEQLESLYDCLCMLPPTLPPLRKPFSLFQIG